MESTPQPKKTSSLKRFAVGAVLFVLWLAWIMLVNQVKVTSLVQAPQARADIEGYAMIFGLAKALAVVGPYWGIRAIMKRL